MCVVIVDNQGSSWDVENLEPAYVRLDSPPVRAAGHGKGASATRHGDSRVSPVVQAPVGPVVQAPRDPGLSGQRLKRVTHVKHAPIYKYAEWCVYWAEKGGRGPDEPMTPRSDLTKSEFDVQYGAWRKALVEGPPRGRCPRILELNQHLREL